MGRFYRTAAARPVDYMHRLNTPLMERVLAANEGFINTRLDVADKLAQFDYEHIDKDDPEAQRLIKEYNDYGEMLSSGIRENAANWREFTPQIKYVQNKLLKDYKTGTIGKQVANFAARKAAFEQADKDEELYRTSGGTKGTNPIAVQKYKQWWDDNFTGTGTPETGGYNLYQGGKTTPDIDLQKVLGEGLDKVKADKTNEYSMDEYGNHWFFNKETDRREILTQDKILKIAADKVTPAMLNYLYERQQIGEISGAFKDGKFIEPYQYVTPGISSEQQVKIDEYQKDINDFKGSAADKKAMQDILDAQVKEAKTRQEIEWQEGHPLTSPLRGLSNQYAYSDIERGNVLSNNAKGATLFRAAEARHLQKERLDQVWDIHIDDMTFKTQEAKDKMEWERWKHDNPVVKSPSSGVGGLPGVPGVTDKPVETSLSKFATRSFAGWKTHKIDPNTGAPVVDAQGNVVMVDVFSNDGIASKVVTTRKDLENANKRMEQLQNEWDNTKNMSPEQQSLNKAERQKLEIEQRKLSSDLEMYRAWYTAAEDATLNNRADISKVSISPEEKKEYLSKMQSDPRGQKLYANYEAVRKQYPDVVVDRKTVAGKGVEITDLSPEAKAALAPYNKWMGLKQKVNTGKKNFYNTAQSDVVDNDAIHLSTADSEEVSKMIMANYQGMKLYNEFGKTVDKTLDNKWFNLGKDYELGFAGEQNLPGYITLQNGRVKMTVEDIGTTTNMGDGHAMARVKIEDDTGEIPSGTYYVELNDGVQAQVADKFSKSSNKDIAYLGKAIGDGTANNIRNQMIKPPINRVLGRDGAEPNVYTIEVNDRTGASFPLKVRKIKEGNATKFFITGNGVDGNEQPFPRIPGSEGTDGNFNGMEDFIKAYKYSVGEIDADMLGGSTGRPSRTRRKSFYDTPNNYGININQ